MRHQPLPVQLNSDGVPLDVGRLQRVFAKELRRAVVVRDVGCAFPGCARPASWCQVHHIIHRRDWTVRLGRDRRREFLPPAWIDRERQPRRNT